jgi:hypothetical protein
MSANVVTPPWTISTAASSVSSFQGKDEPLEAIRHFVGQPAEERHGRVRVRVHHARHDDVATGVDDLFGRVALGELRSTDRDDLGASDDERASGNDRPLRVHRHQVSIFYQDIGGERCLG